MRTRVFVLITLMSLALPLLAEDKLSVTMQFDGKTEAISSFSWGVTNTGSIGGGGGGTGKAVFSDFSFTKPVSQLSSVLFQACATGKHYPSVVITVSDKKGHPYYEIKLVDVMVSSYQLSNGGGDSNESSSLNFASIQYILIGL